MSTLVHPSEGCLRRLLDEPFLVQDRTRRHVAGCARCSERLGRFGQARARVGAMMVLASSQPGLSANQAAARLQLSPASSAPGRGRLPALPVTATARKVRKWALACAGACVVVGGGLGTAAAEGWITISRPAQVAPVALPQGALLKLPHLRDFGQLASSERPQLHEVATLAAAEAASGEHLALPRQPPVSGSGSPRFAVVKPWSATFTFSAAAAQATAARLGVTLPPLPSGFNGAQLRETVGPAALAIYPSSRRSTLGELPAFAALSMAAPVLQSTGPTVKELMNYLLGIPWLPSGLAQAIRGLGDPAATLPVPVPYRLGASQSTQVGSDPAVLITGPGDLYSAVVWEQRGTVHAIFAQLSPDEVMALARSGD